MAPHFLQFLLGMPAPTEEHLTTTLLPVIETTGDIVLTILGAGLIVALLGVCLGLLSPIAQLFEKRGSCRRRG